MYYSFEELIKDLGVNAERFEQVSVVDNQDDFPHSQMAECYFNASMAVANDPERYQYTLGVAKCENGFYYPHAYLYDKEMGKYVDPTWRSKIDQSYWVFRRFSFSEVADFISEKDQPPMFCIM